MKSSLFRPRQFVTPPSLVLVPYFSQASLLAGLKKRARRQQGLLHSSWLWFANMALITGFIGYPHLLTLLGLVAGLEDKEVYFLGSAGALQPRFRAPQAVQVGEIRPSSVFKRFSRSAALPLTTFADASFPVVSGVSVDIIQRENPAWLAGQRSLRTDIVEMELFPLRCFLGRPFHALVVLSDRVRESGIIPFAAREPFDREFHRAFHAITRCIDHEESHPHPPLPRRSR
ncbi:MAG TPA: hypothetical protein VF451_01865 [Acidobacteriota bacterium]